MSFTETSLGRMALASLVGTRTSGIAMTMPRSAGGSILTTSNGS